MIPKIICIVSLVLAAAAVIYSVYATCSMFKQITSDSEENTAESKVSKLKSYRVRMIISYAAAILFITLSAVMKYISK